MSVETLFYVRPAIENESYEARDIIEAAGRWSGHWAENAVSVLCRGDNKMIGFVRHWTDSKKTSDRAALSVTVSREYRGNDCGLFLLSGMMQRIPAKNWYLDIDSVENGQSDWRVQYYKRVGFDVISSSEIPSHLRDLIHADAKAAKKQAFMRCAIGAFKPVELSPESVQKMACVQAKKLSW